MLKRSKNRQKILEVLKDSVKPKSSKDISIETGIIQNSVIRSLNELEKEKAVQEVSETRRWRTYRITDKGLTVLKIIKE